MARLHGVDSAAERRALIRECEKRASGRTLGGMFLARNVLLCILLGLLLMLLTGPIRVWNGAFLMVGIIVITIFNRRWTVTRRELPGVLADAGRCVACAYLLDAALSERCPECGTLRPATDMER